VIEQKSPFIRLDLAGAEEAQTALRGAGLDCRGRDDETTLLWEKLVFLAPVALATAALHAPLGAVREDPSFVACREEAGTAARAAGAAVDLDPICALHEAAPPAMQSSMQKDVAAGREPELAAIAGPIVRLGAEHGFPTAATQSLVERVRARSHESVRNP
jgi:2-dehydropantoate 2-reductase